MAPAQGTAQRAAPSRGRENVLLKAKKKKRKKNCRKKNYWAQKLSWKTSDCGADREHSRCCTEAACPF